MKLSIFNNRIPLSDNTDLLFNSFTEEGIIIEKKMNLSLIEMSSEFITILIKRGFLVDDEIDEYKKVYDIFKKNYTNDNIFKLTINPTLNCNFRCWYCYESHSTNSIMSIECLEKVKRSINWLSKKYKEIELAFFGGEPFLQYTNIVKPLIEYIDILSHNNQFKYQVTFTTNGYLLTKDIIKELTHYNIGISQITLDGGPDSHNKTRISKKKDSFFTIVKNIKKMVESDLPILLRINVTKDNIEDASKIVNYFKDIPNEKKIKIKVLVQQVWQDIKNDIIDEIWSLYSDFMDIGISPWPRRFNFYHDFCYADKLHSAVINYDGKIHKCTAINFDEKEPDGILSENGEIHIEEVFNLRLTKRRLNQLCKRCRILPVCNGGCSKNIDQAKIRDYCLHPSEKDKNNVVKNIIREQLHMSKLGLSWKV